MRTSLEVRDFISTHYEHALTDAERTFWLQIDAAVHMLPLELLASMIRTLLEDGSIAPLMSTLYCVVYEYIIGNEPLLSPAMNRASVGRIYCTLSTTLAASANKAWRQGQHSVVRFLSKEQMAVFLQWYDTVDGGDEPDEVVACVHALREVYEEMG